MECEAILHLRVRMEQQILEAAEDSLGPVQVPPVLLCNAHYKNRERLPIALSLHSLNGLSISRPNTVRLHQRLYLRTNRFSLRHQHSQQTCVAR
jgi:hypothetical protein